jgi:hypothetical protein
MAFRAGKHDPAPTSISQNLLQKIKAMASRQTPVEKRNTNKENNAALAPHHGAGL